VKIVFPANIPILPLLLHVTIAPKADIHLLQVHPCSVLVFIAVLVDMLVQLV
jgi:hypothetical protein